MTDQRKQQSRKIARVFVLGSGFSASMGLPTQADLFDALMNVPERGGERDQENLLLTLEALYPGFDRERPVYPRFEEFLGMVIAAQHFPLVDDYDWTWKRKSALRKLTDLMASRCTGHALPARDAAHAMA
jgi:hypothetical protein